MKISYQRILLLVGTGVLLIVAAWSSLKIHLLSARHAAIKKDYSDVNRIGNGLLSVDVWRDQIIRAADYQIEHFKLTKAERDTLVYEIRELLHAVINKADTLLDKKPETLGGKIKKMAANIFIDEDKIHAQVPEFAETIEHELLKEKNREKLKYLVEDKIRQLGRTTYDSSKKAKPAVPMILKKYDANNVEDFNKKTIEMSEDLKQRTYIYTFITLGVMFTYLLLWVLLQKKPELHISFFLMSVALALVMLLVALTTPMIEIDARIKSLDFHLIGEKISFQDQVIFFQSKSITDVVKILLKTGKYDSVIVGCLILIFSIVFPFSKLISTGIYLLYDKWKHNKLVNFFAFKSGKWSMADVNVIAIFMSYIGFKGILDDQLTHLNVHNETLESISTNHTSLQPGYILFIGFVLFGLVLSLILGKITHHGEKQSQ